MIVVAVLYPVMRPTMMEMVRWNAPILQVGMVHHRFSVVRTVWILMVYVPRGSLSRTSSTDCMRDADLDGYGDDSLGQIVGCIHL